MWWKKIEEERTEKTKGEKGKRSEEENTQEGRKEKKK